MLAATRNAPDSRLAVAREIAVVATALAAATGAAALLEIIAGIADASPVYLLAVVLAASRYGTGPAVAVSGLSFLLYDFLFTVPRFTFAVSDPAEWLSLLLFLLIAVVIGRLAGLLRERAEVADRRSRESVSLAAIGREIAMATSFDEAAPQVAERLRFDAEMATVTVELEGGAETVADGDGRPPEIADSVTADASAEPAELPEPAEPPWTLLRSATDDTSDWVRVVGPGPIEWSAPPGHVAFVVPIEADGRDLGTIRATRPVGSPMPGRGARRILSLAADQLGIAMRRGDALRAAILDSVSHDLRTPLASIRATAGGLLDQGVEPSPAEVRTAAAAIDAEAERLGDIVRSLLDMGRIQAGAVRPDVEPYEVDELVETAVRRVAGGTTAARVRVAIPSGLPPVGADAVLVDVALGNVIDNALRHAPGARVRITAEASGDATAVLVHVDDAGPGVSADELSRLFERFYRVPDEAGPARHGLGMGLAIARGFVEAMGGAVSASRSDLGGLRLTIRLPAAPPGPGRASDDATGRAS